MRRLPSSVETMQQAENPAGSRAEDLASVSVITRNCGRLPLLRRCFQTLRAAALPGTEWIIVEDGEKDCANLKAFAAEARREWDGTIKIVGSSHRHRAKAANVGIRAATGAFVHFFDDDDTIAPEFYTKTIGFLRSQPRFGAVATLSENVLERMLPDGTFEQVSRIRHYPELRVISLAEFAVVQTFAPIAFVASRSAVEATGPFDETLEVCEDYEFYLRFLTRFDIAVLPEVLCAFHRRKHGTQMSQDMRNSPASINHRLEDKLFRNTLLRRDLESGTMGIGWLLAFGDMTRASWRANLVFDALQRRRLPRLFLNWLRRDV